MLTNQPTLPPQGPPQGMPQGAPMPQGGPPQAMAPANQAPMGNAEVQSMAQNIQMPQPPANALTGQRAPLAQPV